MAPFWNDVDVRQSGHIFFRFSEDEGLLEEVGARIEAGFQEHFLPDMVFVATWHRVSGFARSSNLVGKGSWLNTCCIIASCIALEQRSI